MTALRSISFDGDAELFSIGLGPPHGPGRDNCVIFPKARELQKRKLSA
jgi:hypothetical protein